MKLTPLLTPCMPVNILARVVVQPGVAQALSNTMPCSARASKLGVLGKSAE